MTDPAKAPKKDEEKAPAPAEGAERVAPGSRSDHQGAQKALSQLSPEQLAMVHRLLQERKIKGNPEFRQVLVTQLLPPPGEAPGEQEPRVQPLDAREQKAPALPKNAPRETLSPERVSKILTEAERQWKMGFSRDHDQHLKFGTSSEHWDIDRGEKGWAVNHQWCAAYAMHCYKAAGLSHEVAVRSMSNTKLLETVTYQDEFSREHVFFDSAEQVTQDPQAGIQGMKAYHKHVGQRRKGIEVLAGDMAPLDKANAPNITRLEVDPEDPAAAFASADIKPGDIMITGYFEDGEKDDSGRDLSIAFKAGRHFTIVSDVSAITRNGGGYIGTIEGNTGAGGETFEMSEKAEKLWNALIKEYVGSGEGHRVLMPHQLDTRYIEEQAPLAEEFIEYLDDVKKTYRGGKGWRHEARLWVAQNIPGFDERWLKVSVQWTNPKSGARRMRRQLKKLTNKKFVERVRAFEAETGNNTRVEKGKDHSVIARQEKETSKVGQQKGAIRFFHRLAERDFQPYFYMPLESWEKIKGDEKK